MSNFKSFDYVFFGSNIDHLNSIQYFFEKKSIYPTYRQVDNINSLKITLNEKLWDIFLICDDGIEIDIKELNRVINNNRFSPRAIWLSNHFDEDKVVYLMKNGLSNCVKSDDLEKLYKIVTCELEELNKIREENRYTSVAENIVKYDIIRRFAGNVSHKINEMLMVILNTAAYLSSDKSLSSDSRYEIENITRAGMKSLNLARDLLKVSSGVVLNTTIVNIDNFLTNLISKLRNVLGDEIDINYKRSKIGGDIKIDEDLITEAFQNVALYLSSKATGSEEISMFADIVCFDGDEIFLKKSSLRAGEYFKITIGKAGQKINKEEIKHIFEPYYTNLETSKSDGLALSVSYGIIWEHNGIIDVEYNEKGWINFVIYLPVFKKDSKEILLPRVSEFAPVSKGTVLIVDDDDDVKNILIRIFSEGGFNIIDAIDGLGALVMLQKKKPSDLVALITDVIMPKMNGLELAREVREKYNNVKVVFLSGYPDNNGEILNFPNSIFVQKPITRDVLMKIVKSFLFGEKSE